MKMSPNSQGQKGKGCQKATIHCRTSLALHQETPSSSPGEWNSVLPNTVQESDKSPRIQQKRKDKMPKW